MQVIIEDNDNYHGPSETVCLKYVDETHLKINYRDLTTDKYKIYGRE